MSNFRECPSCGMIEPIFGHDCYVGRYQLIPATLKLRDAGVAELERQMKEARGAAYLHLQRYHDVLGERNTLAAERDQARAERDAMERRARAYEAGATKMQAERDAAVEALKDMPSIPTVRAREERLARVLAQLPTAAEAEYAALCRVASAAEALIAGIPTNEHGWYDPVNQAQERALTDALAELRRARGNGGSDGSG